MLTIALLPVASMAAPVNLLQIATPEIELMVPALATRMSERPNCVPRLCQRRHDGPHP